MVHQFLNTVHKFTDIFTPKHHHNNAKDRPYELAQSYHKDRHSNEKLGSDDPYHHHQKHSIGKFHPDFMAEERIAHVHEKQTVKIAPGMHGRPIEEVDPFVFDETFCVISKKFNKNFVYRFAYDKSLWLFGPMNPFRRFCIAAITHQAFDLVIILVILFNCAALAFDGNELVRPSNSKGTVSVEPKDACSIDGEYTIKSNNLPQELEWTFLLIYTVEAILKICAKGFVLNKHSYLRNQWNVLDFVIVVVGYITEAIELKRMMDVKSGRQLSTNGIDADVLRSFRVLRAIKTFSILPGLRMMINALLNSAVQLLEVMALTFFCLCIFCLFALEVFSNKLHHVCVLVKGTTTSRIAHRDPSLESIGVEDGEQRDYLWRIWVNDRSNWLMRDFPKEEYVPCGNETGARHCPEGYVCLPNLNSNPDEGWTSFDTFFQSMLSTFQLVTLDYWERLYDLVMSASGPLCVLFFVVVVFLGSFYLLNLMLAVVTKSYEAEASNWNPSDAKPLTRNQKLALHRSDSTFSFDDPMNLHVTILTTKFVKRTPFQREFLAQCLKHGVGQWSHTAGFPTASAAETITDAMTQLLETKLKAERELDPDEIDLIEEAKKEEKMEEDVVLSQDDHQWTIGSDKDESNEDEDDEKEGDDTEDLSEYEEFDDDPSLPENPPGSIIIERSHKMVEDDPTMVDVKESSTARKITEHRRGGVHKFGGQTEQYMDQVQVKLVLLVSHWLFEAFITSCIILNTLLLACEHQGQPKWLEMTINIGSYCFTGVFIIEFILKTIALRLEYFKHGWNRFDIFVTFLSLLDVILGFLSVSISSSFRVLRLLRIFKLAQSWVTMKILLSIIFSTFGALGNLVLVLGIVIYIFAVLGMQIAGKRYIPSNFGQFGEDSNHHEDFPRWNFSNFYYSFMMVFRVLCGEWIEPLWDCLIAHKANDQCGGSEWRCFVIFLPILVIGNFIVLNLFLALLLNSFSTEELKAQRDREQEASGKADNLKKIVGLLLTKKVLKGVAKDKEQAEKAITSALIKQNDFSINTNEVGESRPRVMFKKATQKVILQHRKSVAEKVIAKLEENEWRREAGKSDIVKSMFRRSGVLREGGSGGGGDGRNKSIGPKSPKRFASNPAISTKRKKRHSIIFGRALQTTASTGTITGVAFDLDEEKPILLPNCFPDCCATEKVQCCLSWEASREFAQRIVYAPWFEWLILALILGSSVTLCFEDIYLEEKADLKLILFILNNLFTILFIVEMCFKWMALGLNKYFRTFWTILDFVIVVISLISLVFDIEHESWKPQSTRRQSFGSLKALRTLRALRPLRAISRWQGMKVCVNALMFAIPSIFNVLLVCLLFWLVFAIMGVNFFRGKFYKCVYYDGALVPTKYLRIPALNDLASDKERCCSMSDITTHRNATSWVNTFPNFDNVMSAYLSLFQIATFEGWMEIMAAASDINKVDGNPERAMSYNYYSFFVIFIIFGGFFTLNLFIGVIIDNFNMLKKKYEGNLLEVLLSPAQKRYYTAMKKLGKKKPRKVVRRPTKDKKILRVFYDISMSRRFEFTIFFIIFLNMVVLAVDNNLSSWSTDMMQALNFYFTCVYAIEAIIKIVGLRLFYFKIPWNVFDFIIVILSIVDLSLVKFTAYFPFPPTMLRVVRVFRIGRVLRLIKAAKGIRKLLFALIVSLPALFNIGALLALVTFIYAILGMALFKDADMNGPIDDVFSFETFIKSFLMLLRLLTAAGWNEVLDALVEPGTVCGDYRRLKCGRPGEKECIPWFQPILYMVTYIILTYLIIINMYIAIILENFNEANRDEEVGIVEDDIESFYGHWSRFDPDATQFIHFEALSNFLASLDPPLNIPRPNNAAIVSFDLPIAKGNKIHCLDILHALVKHVLGEIEDSEEFRKVQAILEKAFHKEFPERKQAERISSTNKWKYQNNAAIAIQRAWRAYRRRKQKERLAAGTGGLTFLESARRGKSEHATRIAPHSFKIEDNP